MHALAQGPARRATKFLCMMVHAWADLGCRQENDRSVRCELCGKLEKRSILASDAVPGQRKPRASCPHSSMTLARKQAHLVFKHSRTPWQQAHLHKLALQIVVRQRPSQMSAGSQSCRLLPFLQVLHTLQLRTSRPRPEHSSPHCDRVPAGRHCRICKGSSLQCLLHNRF